MLTMRPIEKDGKWGQKSHTVNGRKINTVDWNDRDKAEEWRRAWAAYANGALRIAGVQNEDNILDHRSYERQGIDQIPTVHLGVAANQMEKRGIRTERGDINRAIEISNAELRQIRARIKKLQKWIGEERKAEPPTVFDVVTAILNGKENRSQYEKLYDLKLAAKVQLFMEQNHLLTITDLRGKVGDFYGKQQSLGERLNKIDRRLKTLDEHIKHSGNFKKYRGYKAQYEKLYADYKTARKSTGLFAKSKAQKALDAANGYVETYRVEIGQFETAEKYLRDVLQGRFDPKHFPVTKWKKEQETLKAERGGLNREYAVLKEQIREVEVIRKYAEEAQRTINPPQKKREQGLEI
jgi:hypothetical protein